MCTIVEGITTYAKLRANGISRRQIDVDTRAETLVRLRRGVYGRAGVCADVVTAARHGGALACVTAARHLGLWVLADEDDVHVWMGKHARSHAHTSCTCVAHWDGSRPGDAFGVPSLPRVLLQILGCRGVEEFFVAVESALRQRMITRRQLSRLRAYTGPAGREAIDFACDTSDSGLESLLRWRLRRYGLTVRAQVRIASVGIVDLLIGDRLIIEADGNPNHGDGPHRHKDLLRDANATMWGYITLRFDYAMIVHDWDTVERAILAAVDHGMHLAR